MKWNEVAQSCPALCDPMDCSLLGSSVHGIFQTRVLEWVAISFSRGSSRPRDWTRVSHIVDKRFTIWTTREVQGFKSALQPCLCSLCLSRSPPSPGCPTPTSSYIWWQYLRWWLGSFQGVAQFSWWSPRYNGGEHVIKLLFFFLLLISLLLQRSLAENLEG